MQVWIADRLRTTALGRYSVEREGQVIERKKPDIRLSCPSSDGPVTIEVKCADNWRGPELESALHNQLVGQYLRDNASRFGILLLTHHGQKRRWGIGSQFTFSALTNHLQHMAREIAKTNPAVEDLKICTISFSAGK